MVPIHPTEREFPAFSSFFSDFFMAMNTHRLTQTKPRHNLDFLWIRIVCFQAGIISLF